MRMRSIKLKFRDGYNKLIGKQPLIDEYNQIAQTICNHTDHMPSGDKKKEIISKFNALDETTFTPSKDGASFSVGGFNPYYAANAELRKKIAEGNAIIAKYGIKRKSEVR